MLVACAVSLSLYPHPRGAITPEIYVSIFLRARAPPGGREGLFQFFFLSHGKLLASDSRWEPLRALGKERRGLLQLAERSSCVLRISARRR